MSYSAVLKELYSLENIKFSQTLINMKVLLKKLGNPEKNLKYIHVAGTNGKGSVCAMISSILINAGYNVGMYTSPHLKKFNERIRINNNLISDDKIIEYYLRIKKHVTNQTFFEITTAMAFLYFKEKNPDFIVLETGLGGRLDSTNVITPLISIITNIGVDHTEYLGSTINKIAFEKSGIIKRNIPVVTAAEGIALKTIKKISNKNNSILIIINKNNIKINYNINKSMNKEINNFNEFNLDNKEFNEKNNHWTFDFNEYKNLKLDNLNGTFQALNATITIKAIQTLKNDRNLKINKNNIKKGLSDAKWPGRFQFIEKNILVDCAHNPDGFRILVNELKNIKYDKLFLIVGFSNDKDIKSISKLLNKYPDKIIITKSSNNRAINPIKIKKYFNYNSTLINDPKKALKFARKNATKNDLILVTGSIFLVGEII